MEVKSNLQVAVIPELDPPEFKLPAESLEMIESPGMISLGTRVQFIEIARQLALPPSLQSEIYNDLSILEFIQYFLFIGTVISSIGIAVSTDGLQEEASGPLLTMISQGVGELHEKRNPHDLNQALNQLKKVIGPLLSIPNLSEEIKRVWQKMQESKESPEPQEIYGPYEGFNKTISFFMNDLDVLNEGFMQNISLIQALLNFPDLAPFEERVGVLIRQDSVPSKKSPAVFMGICQFISESLSFYQMISNQLDQDLDDFVRVESNALNSDYENTKDEIRNDILSNERLSETEKTELWNLFEKKLKQQRKVLKDYSNGFHRCFNILFNLTVVTQSHESYEITRAAANPEYEKEAMHYLERYKYPYENLFSYFEEDYNWYREVIVNIGRSTQDLLTFIYRNKKRHSDSLNIGVSNDAVFSLDEAEIKRFFSGSSYEPYIRWTLKGYSYFKDLHRALVGVLDPAQKLVEAHRVSANNIFPTSRSKKKNLS